MNCNLAKAKRRGFRKFSSVFPVCAQLLLPKSQWFNQQQAKLASVGRLWSYAGLVVWFRAVWTTVYRTEPFILMDIPFICVTHACPICIFEENSEPTLGPAVVCLCVLTLVFALSGASNHNGEREREKQRHCSAVF